MQTADELLNQIRQKNIDTGVRSPDDVLRAIKSGEIQYNEPNENFTNSNDLGTLTGAFGLGAANMINNTVTGGTGWLLGNLGRGIEYISPFSGRDDDTVNSLLNAGHTLEEIDQILPYEDSWITSAAKGTLGAHNAIDDAIKDWRNDLLGDNPTLAARVAEGSGSSIGFILSGLAAAHMAAAPGAAGLLGAATSGTLESISETGGFLGDAYRQGQYDNGAIGTANKDFLSNVGLNTGLNYTVGAFNPHIRGIVNPVNRWLASTAGETVNELLQEPSQQTIEQAAMHSLNTNSDFLPNLYDSTMGNGNFEGKGWWDTAKQLAPEVALSTLLTQGLVGATGVSTKQGRKNFMTDWNRRNEPRQTVTQNADTTSNVPNVTPNAPDSNNNSGEQITTPYEPGTQQLGFTMPNTANTGQTAQNLNQNTQQQTPRVTPQIESDTQTAPTAKSGSNTTRIRTMKGTEVDARYRVIDANDLITSTTERGGLNPNYLAELQPRDRGTTASDTQIRSIANNLDPELLGESRLASDGAPVIGSDLMVESGNGRVMAIRNAYKYGKAEHYRQWVKDNASYFGIDPAYIDSVQNPVLVRERISDVDRVKFTSEANESSIATMSTTEHALDDAKKITPEILTHYDSDQTLEDNKTFLNWFVGVMPKNEQGDLKQKDGRISRSGIDRARNALVALAYNDAGILRRLSESYDDEVKNVTDGLTAAAPKVAIFENGNHSKELSIRQDILQALNTLADLRANKQSVDDYLSQILMFDEDKISPEARMLLKFFDDNKRSYKRIAQGLIDYTNLAMNEAQEGQGLLFDDSTHTKSELLQQAVNTRVHSKEFINWFGDWQNSPKKASKVVDKNGFPLTVYHGTETKTGTINGETTDTWFYSNPKEARNLGARVDSSYLDIKNPYRAMTKDTNTMAQLVSDVKSGKYGEGYDGVIFQSNNNNVGDVYVAFKPEQVKSTSDTEFEKNDKKDIHNQDRINRADKSSLIQQFTQQIIDMGHPQYGPEGAQAIAQLFDARIRAFAKYAGINPDDYIKSKNFNITYDEDTSGINSDKRGRSEFIPARYDSDGNIIREAQTIIRIFKDADRSTILHELGHVFLKDLRDSFADGKLKGVAKQDWDTLTKWLGVSDIDFTKGLSEQQRQRWTDAHEKFATGFEKYLMTGKAPTAKLKRAFEAFKRWLTNIYHSVRNITYTGTDGQQHPFALSDEVKQVMDRLLDENPGASGEGAGYAQSLTDNNTTVNNEESYNQILGEQGANAIDESEGTNTRMDNLNVAKQMEAAGKYARTIRLATGWEKGHDGKWRWEIMDGKLIEKTLKNNKKSFALSEIFDAPELFRAYKELPSMRVQFENLGESLIGQYNPATKSISINQDYRSLAYSPLIQSNLVHEIQHAIQNIEGFARGTNSKSFEQESNLYNSKRQELLDKMQEIVDEAKIDYQEAVDMVDKQLTKEVSGDIYMDRIYQAIRRLVKKKLGIQRANEYDNLLHELSALQNDWKAKYNSAEDQDDIYHNSTGETEARNAQTRMNWTEEQRRNNTLESSEDVSRSQQIEIYNQILGEKAARQLDAQEGVTTRMDNLEVAKQMTQAGKDAKTIWQATGWELGKEGRWKFEIPDGRLTDKFRQLKEIVEHYNALKGTQKEQEMPIDQIKKILGNITLSDIINAPDLFKAYPELQQMKVSLDNIQGNAMAYYSPTNKSITLDVAKIDKSRLDPRSVLIHELQHAVQDIEGFAQGGNMNVGDNIRRKADTYGLFRAISDQHEQHPEITDSQQLVNRAIKDFQELGLPVPNEQIISDALALYNNGEGIDSEKLKSYESAYNTRYKVNNEYNPNDRETYSKLAGEIEAKNAETRLNATEGLRKRTPPSQTEKIGRSQQIVIQKDKNGVETYAQRLPPRTRLKSWLKNMLRGKPRITLNSAEAQSQSQGTNDSKIPQSGNPYSFLNPETERRYKESEKGVQQSSIGGKIRQATRNLLHSFRGDFSELANDDSLIYAREQFRNLQRAKSRQVQEAMKSFTDNLKALSPLQRDIFARKRMLDDLNWRSKNTPDAELPFGFDRESLKREFDRFTKIASRNKAVMQAIQAEEKTMQAISQEFVKLAEQLGLKLDKVFRNPHYYRHTILEYANAAMTHGSRLNTRRSGNTDTLQGLVDEKLNGILNRSYMKRYRGSAKDINTNYIQANGEVRAQMLMDIEVMKTLLDIKQKYDIAPRLRDKLKQIFNQGKNSGNEGYSQESEQTSLSDLIPEGYTIWNPAGSRLIQSANSVSENVIAMALDDAAEASGVPIDKLLNSLGDTGEEFLNQLCVIPNGIAETLQKMSKRRDRGILGSAAKTLTTWWKKAVLFTPTRNLKYNFRNLTGDLDALIAGNPGALRFAGQAFKDLLSHYRGKSTSQDLQDYMNRSGGLNVESMQFSDKEIQDLQNLADDLNKSENLSMPKKAWNLVKKFFDSEVTFTQAREHWLRYAAYLAYLEDMQNNNGTPSTWGASIQEEVMAVDDIHDRAFKMSNELLGAYDQVSEAGQQLREMLIPFYSWMEVNMRRYYRLFKNGLSGKNNSDFIKRFLLGKTAKVPFYALSAADTFAKISLLTMAVQMINRFLFPDDDDELTPDVKYRPHITLGKVGGKVYYFDRIGALADAADWFALDSIFLDARDLANGQQSLGGYMKKVMTAPASKIINGLNPMLKMPFEIATGRSLYPDINNPRTIRDTGKYLAQSFALNYPYKLIKGEPHSTLDEFTNMMLYSSDPDEAAYFYSLDRVRQYQERVLDRKFDGFATSKRGRVLQRLKTALRYNDKKAVQQCLKEYAQLDGSKQGLKQSMKAMDPLHGLSKEEKKKFLRWLSSEDKKYLAKANRYFHSMADRFIK